MATSCVASLPAQRVADVTAGAAEAAAQLHAPTDRLLALLALRPLSANVGQPATTEGAEMLRDQQLPLVLEILWDGPHEITTVCSVATAPGDYGVYQIYGTHNVLGSDTLLYIGKAGHRPFATRLEEHRKEWISWEPSRTSVFLGRLGGADQMTEDRWPEWNQQIDIAERILIYYCAPPYNSSGLSGFPDNTPDTLVLNFGQRHRLPPELSTFWHRGSWAAKLFKAYGQ